MKLTLSPKEARSLILNSQKLLNTNNTTLSTIEHLGYIQIDTLSVVQRAYHHTSDLDTLVKDGKVFEYWSHAASYLPMSEYR